MLNKNKILIRNLSVFGFLLILINIITNYKVVNYENLLAYEENTIYTSVSSKYLLDNIDSLDGVILVVDNKRDANKYSTVLNKIDDTNIYVYISSSKEDNSELLNLFGLYAQEDAEGNLIKPLTLFIQNGNLLFSYSMIEDIDLENIYEIYKAGFSQFLALK